MNNENYANNKVYLTGEIITEPVYSHELFGEGFYEFFMQVPRLSGSIDTLPVTVSERLLTDQIKVGERIALSGQFRSYNKILDDKSKLMLTVFVRDFLPLPSDDENPNICELNGYVCKQPVYRTTPFNREICDLLIAVNRGYNKSDYIPCIAWGRNARFVRSIKVGQNIQISGRIQSRKYVKRLDESTAQERTAYELSVNKITCESACVDTATTYYDGDEE
ncbi:MAG: single-stranded DNA-binding protein [Clostridia bacterium]|nr:single-stranded DNA-binding protein [Clostridia bacterium]